MEWNQVDSCECESQRHRHELSCIGIRPGGYALLIIRVNLWNGNKLLPQWTGADTDITGYGDAAIWAYNKQSTDKPWSVYISDAGCVPPPSHCPSHLWQLSLSQLWAWHSSGYITAHFPSESPIAIAWICHCPFLKCHAPLSLPGPVWQIYLQLWGRMKEKVKLRDVSYRKN